MSKLSELLGVEDGQEFKLDEGNNKNYKFRVNPANGFLQKAHIDDSDWHVEDMGINSLLTLNATPINKYSLATIEAAKKDSFRFKYVARDKHKIEDRSTLFLFKKHTKLDDSGFFDGNDGDYVCIPDIDYPEVKPSECVELREIIGGANT